MSDAAVVRSTTTDLEKHNWHITVNGLWWFGGNLVTAKTSTNKSALTVNGCFISGGTAGIDLNFDSDLAFTWDARASIAVFNTSPRPAAIKIVAWKP
jgi:hypothetical protein